MSTFTWLSAQTDTIIYIGDPMCSWCYGFAPELDKVKTAFPEMEFKLVMGGLRPYGKETMGGLHDFLKEHWEEIGKRTGQPFKYDILEDSNFIYDTEPSARAVVVARALNPEKELTFFKAVQTAFYSLNQDTHNVKTYSAIAEELGMDKTDFEAKFQSDQFKELVKADYQLSAQLGIRGFPSMVLKKEGQYYLLSNGYLKAENLEKVINGVLQEK